MAWKHIEYDPMKSTGLNGVDYMERINWDRLRKDRVKKLQKAMKKTDTDALLVYLHNNVRYATSTRFVESWSNQIHYRYALIPRDKDPILFEFVGEETFNRQLYSPWVVSRMRPAIIYDRTGAAKPTMLTRWADDMAKVLKDEGLQDGKIGLDYTDITAARELEQRHINLIDGWPALFEARKIKTPDELECLKYVCSVVDGMFYELRHGLIRPGVRECDLAGFMLDYMTRRGFDSWEAIIVASGGYTNPYLREFTDKPLREGDLVTFDEGGTCGPGGYKSDYVRTYLVGDTKPTEEQKTLYKECYESLYDSIKAIKPGSTTKDVAENFPVYEDDKYKTVSMLQWGHGVGDLVPEEPTINRVYSMEYPEQIEEGMYLAVETFAAKPGGKNGVRLEENLVVTDTGTEVFSLAPFDERLLG